MNGEKPDRGEGKRKIDIDIAGWAEIFESERLACCVKERKKVIKVIVE